MHFAAALAANTFFFLFLQFLVVCNYKNLGVMYLCSTLSLLVIFPRWLLSALSISFLESFLCLFWCTSGHQIYAITLAFVHLLIQGYLLHAPAPATPLAHLHGEWCD